MSKDNLGQSGRTWNASLGVRAFTLEKRDKHGSGTGNAII